MLETFPEWKPQRSVESGIAAASETKKGLTSMTDTSKGQSEDAGLQGRRGAGWRRPTAVAVGLALVLGAASPTQANPGGGTAGLRPAVIAPTAPSDPVEQKLSALLRPALTVAQDTQVRALVRNAAGRRLSGDSEVLLSTVISEAEQSRIVNPSAPDWVAFKNAVASFANINGHRYEPQVLIPNYGEGIVIGSTVTMVHAPANESLTTLTGYRMAGGALTPVAGIDEAYSETNEVWVLSTHERVPTVASVASTATSVAQQRGAAVDGAVKGAASADVACNTTGVRNERGQEYLKRYQVPNPSDFEHWTSGKLEMRLIVLGKGGAQLKNAYFGKVKRRDIKSGINLNLFITTWDRAQWGDYWAYQWAEVDNGPTVEWALSLTAKITEKLGITGSVKVTKNNKDDDAGSGMVGFAESTNIEYGTGTVGWKVCSVGGDGGTGDDNFARSGIAAASTTYPGYSPARVNDGSTNTTVGPEYSWANANRVPMPQWVQVDFNVEKTFRRIVLYTSATYPIQDFDVQVFNGVTFVTVQQVRGNTQPTRTISLPTAHTGRLVRISGLRGPSHQPQYVRVNELEVYAV